jgi:hypothetical protein
MGTVACIWKCRYHSHAALSTDLTNDATHAGNTHPQIVTVTFETLPSSEARNRATASVGNLFLLGLGLLSLGLRALLTDTDKAGLGAGVTELPVGVLGGLVLADGALLESNNVLDGKTDGGAGDNLLTTLGSLEVLSRGIAVLALAAAAGEEDKALPVLLETLDVGLEALLGKVLAARVDRDTDGTSELAGNASS